MGYSLVFTHKLLVKIVFSPLISLVLLVLRNCLKSIWLKKAIDKSLTGFFYGEFLLIMLWKFQKWIQVMDLGHTPLVSSEPSIPFYKLGQGPLLPSQWTSTCANSVHMHKTISSSPPPLLTLLSQKGWRTLILPKGFGWACYLSSIIIWNFAGLLL